MASPSPRSREHIVLQFTNLGVNFTCQNTSGCEVRIIACIRYSRSGTVEKFQGNCRNCKATFHRQVRGFVRQGDMLGQVHRNDDFSKKCTITLPLPEEYETVSTNILWCYVICTRGKYMANREQCPLLNIAVSIWLVPWGVPLFIRSAVYSRYVKPGALIC